MPLREPPWNHDQVAIFVELACTEHLLYLLRGEPQLAATSDHTKSSVSQTSANTVVNAAISKQRQADSRRRKRDSAFSTRCQDVVASIDNSSDALRFRLDESLCSQV